MNDRLLEQRRGSLLLTTDRDRIDVDRVLAMLLVSHWGGAMTKPLLERAIENSVCFSVLESPEANGAELGAQLGFARAVTDLATYAYITDVIVAEEARGRGIGTWMVEAIVGHPDFHGLRRIALFTRDARPLYEKFGFSTDMPASTYMELRARR